VTLGRDFRPRLFDGDPGMLKSATAAWLIAASISITAPQAAEAQLGSIIKKKVKDAIVKPTEKPAEPAAAPADQPAADSHAAAPADDIARFPGQSGVPLITPQLLDRIQRGMDAELALLADFEKMVARYPTVQQYETCKSNAMMTPEGQKIMSPMMNPPANIKPDEYMAITMKVDTAAKAWQKKKCPLDPNDWNDAKRSDRIQQIHSKAASMARLKSVSNNTSASTDARPALMYEMNPFDMLPDTVADTVIVVRGGGLGDHEYSVAIERVVKYCMLKKEVDVSPKKGGLKAPGSGPGMEWIYTEDELNALKTFDCEAFKKKYAKLLHAYVGD